MLLIKLAISFSINHLGYIVNVRKLFKCAVKNNNPKVFILLVLSDQQSKSKAAPRGKKMNKYAPILTDTVIAI